MRHSFDTRTHARVCVCVKIISHKATTYDSKFTSKQDQIQKHLGTTINLTISSSISDVMLIPVRILRTSDKDAPPDLK